MRTSHKLAALALGTAGAALLALGSVADAGPAAKPGIAPAATLLAGQPGQIVGMRRLTEAQYRNAIADIFGPEVRVAGRFEPIVRPVQEMIASGARDASISPAGLEQYDAMARVIAAQVFDEAHRSQFVDCAPRDAAAADADCAAKVLTPLGRYIFRRPLTAQERDFYVRLAGNGAGPSQSFYKGLELSLAAMLTALILPMIVEAKGGSFDFASSKVLAAVIAGAVAFVWRNTLATLATGMIALWLLQWARG